MIEEPYRWVEAIANRREYIEAQLASGSPIAALGYRDGILFLTVGQARQKIFEIYDRIAMGAIGHPGDIERLRMAAIELASTEGFTRSAGDVSRWANGPRKICFCAWSTTARLRPMAQPLRGRARTLRC
jgi:proteasome alpha subunit